MLCLFDSYYINCKNSFDKKNIVLETKILLEDNGGLFAYAKANVIESLVLY